MHTHTTMKLNELFLLYTKKKVKKKYFVDFRGFFHILLYFSVEGMKEWNVKKISTLLPSAYTRSAFFGIFNRQNV
jgi:hypothetical protein